MHIKSKVKGRCSATANGAYGGETDLPWEHLPPCTTGSWNISECVWAVASCWTRRLLPAEPRVYELISHTPKCACRSRKVPPSPDISWKVSPAPNTSACRMDRGEVLLLLCCSLLKINSAGFCSKTVLDWWSMKIHLSVTFQLGYVIMVDWAI